MKKEKIESIRFNKGMKTSTSNSSGASGGLLVIWKEHLTVDIIYDEGNILLIQFKNLKD